ncbi:hypothetical protein HDV63DRAFT_397286 [Trichoderma sp. SZMC 28014]
MYLVTPLSLSVLLIAGNGVTGHHITARGRDCDGTAIPMADWKALNVTVGGRLHTANPLAEPCYSEYQNSFGEFAANGKAACSTTQANYLNSSFHANQLGGYLNTNWATCQATGQGCGLNFSDPMQSIPSSSTCFQGSVSDYYINVSDVSHVQAGISFAKKHRVPLIVKNTGHDYKGRSSGPGTLALWTHHVQPGIKLSANFTPAGCHVGAGKAVTYGAGQQWEGLYEFAEANDIFLVGGSDLTVGAAGGWILGGGHGFLSPEFGLGVDNTLEMKVVLPNGTYTTASRCHNQDLFFALRGGGGSAFGVVWEVTSRAWDTREVQVVNILFAAASISAYNAFLDLATQNANKWASEGWGGSLYGGGGGRTLIGFQVYNMALSLDDAKASMQSVFDFVASSNNSAQVIEADITTFPTIWQAFEAKLVPILESAGIGAAVASRLIPSDLLAETAGQKAVAAALAEISNDLIFPTSTSQTDPLSVNYTAPIQILLTSPYNYKPVSPGESFSDSSVTPAWRNSTWHVIVIQAFASQADKTTISTAFSAAHAAGEKLRALAPNSGAYQNEADVFETDPVGAYWGKENYDKLKAIKHAIDPDNILTCWDCIGSVRTDDRYQCYPDAAI